MLHSVSFTYKMLLFRKIFWRIRLLMRWNSLRMEHFASNQRIHSCFCVVVRFVTTNCYYFTHPEAEDVIKRTWNDLGLEHTTSIQVMILPDKLSWFERLQVQFRRNVSRSGTLKKPAKQSENGTQITIAPWRSTTQPTMPFELHNVGYSKRASYEAIMPMHSRISTNTNTHK